MIQYDGDSNFAGGQHNGRRPALVPPSFYFRATNFHNRQGVLAPRSGFQAISWTFDETVDQEIFTTGLFQGAIPYGEFRIVYVISGCVFLSDVDGNVFQLSGQILDPNLIEVYLVEAHKQVVISDAVNPVVRVVDLTATQIDMSPCRWMAYGQGRLFTVDPSRNTILASNAFTPLLNDQDELLKFDETPVGFAPYHIGSITGLRFLPITDNGTGIGPLIVTGTRGIYAFDVLAARETWDQIQIGRLVVGAVNVLSHRSLLDIDGDLYFRRQEGIGSLVSARANWEAPVNRPVSHEISGWLKDDAQAHLGTCSSSYSGNLLRMTISPYQSPNGEIRFAGLASMDFEPDSGLASGRPSFPSVETGLEFLQILRDYVIARDSTGSLGIYLIAPESRDLGPDGSEPRIQCTVETRAYHFETPNFGKTISGTCYLDLADIWDEEIDIHVQFKPDHAPDWLEWATRKIKVEEANFGAGYARIPLLTPEDEEVPHPLTDRTATAFGHLQLRITITGRATIERLVLSAEVSDTPDHVDSGVDALQTKTAFSVCPTPQFEYQLA